MAIGCIRQPYFNDKDDIILSEVRSRDKKNRAPETYQNKSSIYFLHFVTSTIKSLEDYNIRQRLCRSFPHLASLAHFTNSLLLTLMGHACKGASIYDVRTEGGGGLAQKKM